MENFLQPKEWEVCQYVVFFSENALFFIQTSPPPKLPPKTCKKQSQCHRKSSITATFSLRLQFTQHQKKTQLQRINSITNCWLPSLFLSPFLRSSTNSPDSLPESPRIEASNKQYQTTSRWWSLDPQPWNRWCCVSCCSGSEIDCREWGDHEWWFNQPGKGRVVGRGWGASVLEVYNCICFCKVVWIFWFEISEISEIEFDVEKSVESRERWRLVWYFCWGPCVPCYEIYRCEHVWSPKMIRHLLIHVWYQHKYSDTKTCFYVFVKKERERVSLYIMKHPFRWSWRLTKARSPKKGVQIAWCMYIIEV